jgi:hypothetical protein
MGADRSPLRARDFGEPKRLLAWTKAISRPYMDVVPNEGSSPVAPAFVTPLFRSPFGGLVWLWLAAVK